MQPHHPPCISETRHSANDLLSPQLAKAPQGDACSVILCLRSGLLATLLSPWPSLSTAQSTPACSPSPASPAANGTRGDAHADSQNGRENERRRWQRRAWVWPWCACERGERRKQPAAARGGSGWGGCTGTALRCNRWTLAHRPREKEGNSGRPPARTASLESYSQLQLMVQVEGEVST